MHGGSGYPMRHGIFFAIICVTYLNALGAADTKVGSVFEVDSGRGEITVAATGGQIGMHQKIYLRVGGKAVLMIATFPMATKTKSRLLPGYGKYLREIRKGVPVFAYVEGIEKESDTKVIQNSGSISELAMLCRKPYKHPSVQKYLRSLGKNFETDEKPRAETFYRIYKKSGIEIRISRPTGERELVFAVAFLHLRNSRISTGWTGYPHELPEKIQFADTRAAVEERLGPPQEPGTGWADYAPFSIQIQYVDFGTTGDAQIEYIRVCRPL